MTTSIVQLWGLLARVERGVELLHLPRASEETFKILRYSSG
jgi:hypothetical protein